MYKKKQGFTLVEAITAMLIVGVVASIMLVGFSRNRDKEFEAKYDKISSTLSSIIDNNLLYSAGMTYADYTSATFSTLLRNELKIKSSYEGAGSISNFWGNTRTIDGVDVSNGYNMYRLNDDIVIATSTATPIKIYIDINGNKGPNVVGKDIRKYSYYGVDDYSKVCVNPSTVHVKDTAERCTNCVGCTNYSSNGGYETRTVYNSNGQSIKYYENNILKSEINYDTGDGWACSQNTPVGSDCKSYSFVEFTEVEDSYFTKKYGVPMYVVLKKDGCNKDGTGCTSYIIQRNAEISSDTGFGYHISYWSFQDCDHSEAKCSSIYEEYDNFLKENNLTNCESGYGTTWKPCS